MAPTHLFVAMGNGAFGEAVLGIRLAHALHARGDRVIFLAPSNLSVLLEGAPFKVGITDAIWARIEEAVAEVARTERCDDVVLVDLASVFLSLSLTQRTLAFLRAVPVPIVALDVWDLPATDLVWDALGSRWSLPREALTVTRRIVPAPFVAPDRPGVYDALPRPPAIDRAAIRAGLGLRDEDRLVLVPSATWQRARAQPTPASRSAAEAFPVLLLDALAPLGVHVLHVGPERFAPSTLGDRYRWQPSTPAARFAELLAASDLLLSLNLSATTIGAAIACELPVVVATSSLAGSPAEVLAALPAPSDALAAWLALDPPLRPFRVWPLGLHDFLGPLFANNPYTDAFTIAPALDLPGLAARCAELLFDRAAADAQRARQRAYAARIHALPSPADAFDRARW